MDFLTSLSFPGKPQNDYVGAAIYLEPMVGSGERIAVCAVAAGNDGVEVLPLIRPEVVRCLYGDKSESFSGLVNLIVESLLKLKNEQWLKEWVAPFDGVHMGAARKIVADNKRQAIASIAKLHASLAYLPALNDDDCDSESAEGSLKAWVSEIKSNVIATSPFLAGNFNRKIQLSKGDEVKFMFADQNNAIETALLLPVGLAGKMNTAKVRLWNMSHLPDQYVNKRLILGVAHPDSPDMADKIVRERLNDRVNALLEQAYKDKITLKTVFTHQEAANEIVALTQKTG